MESNESAITRMAYEPSNLTEAKEVAELYATNTLLPAHFRANPANIFFAMAKGRELGLTSVQSLQSLYVVNGKVGLPGELMLALSLKRKDICEYFKVVKTTDLEATVEAKRVGQEPTTITFTIQDAQRAGLGQRGNRGEPSVWEKYPQNMLRWRAISNLAKLVFPDLFLGCYEEHELKEAMRKEREPQPIPSKPLVRVPIGVETASIPPASAQTVPDVPRETVSRLDEAKARLKLNIARPAKLQEEALDLLRPE